MIVALAILVVFLADMGLHLVLDAPLRTCKTAYEKMQQSNARIVYYVDDVERGLVSELSIDCTSVDEELRVEKDRAENTITFYCYNGPGCCGGKYYSKHIFAFDTEGRLSVYCVLYYNDHKTEAYSKKTYKIRHQD